MLLGWHYLVDVPAGLLLGAFSKTIEAEITKNLDSMLGAGGGATAAPAARKKAAPARKKAP